MPIVRARQRIRGAAPRANNGTFVRGVPDLSQSGKLNSGITIPSQEPPEEIRQYAPPRSFQPDIRALAQSEAMARGAPNFDPTHDSVERHIRHPGAVRLTNYSGNAPHGNLKLFQVFPSRPDRKRFILCNPDVAAGGSGDTMYFTFKNMPNALLPLYPGQTWDESGTEICVDDIWLCFQTKGDAYIAYEGRLYGAYE
jgi:hypothetical protein